MIGSSTKGGPLFLHRYIPTVFILTLAFMPAIALGDDVASLKAVFEKEIAALNASDLETVMTMQHEQIVAMNPGSAQGNRHKACPPRRLSATL